MRPGGPIYNRAILVLNYGDLSKAYAMCSVSDVIPLS